MFFQGQGQKGMSKVMTPEIAYPEVFGEAEHNLYVQLFFLFDELAFSVHLLALTESIFSMKQNLHQYFCASGIKIHQL